MINEANISTWIMDEIKTLLIGDKCFSQRRNSENLVSCNNHPVSYWYSMSAAIPNHQLLRNLSLKQQSDTSTVQLKDISTIPVSDSLARVLTATIHELKSKHEQKLYLGVSETIIEGIDNSKWCAWMCSQCCYSLWLANYIPILLKLIYLLP